MIRSLAVVLCFACLVCIGCGSGADLGQVTGKVTLDDKPLANATVTFSPEGGGRAAVGTTDEDGVYIMAYIDKAGALIGKHKVSVTQNVEMAVSPDTQEAAASSDSEAYMQQAMGGGDTSAYDKVKNEQQIPARYNTQSELTFEVKSGKNTYDIPMTSN